MPSLLSLLDDLVKDCSVALVGNSERILRDKPGARIDRHDVVVRINRGLPSLIDSEAIGSRTTIWATAKHWSDAKAPDDCLGLVWMKLTPMGKAQLPLFQRAHPKRFVYEWPQVYEDECREFVGADPGTGIRLLWWLKTKAKPRSVSVYGMDCWDEPSHWSKKKNTPNHIPQLEREAMLRLL